MTQPDFTDWLRDLEAPETNWRPMALRGSVVWRNVGELIDWVAQGYGTDHTDSLLAQVEKACARRRFDPMDVLIVCHKSETVAPPFEVRSDRTYHASADDDQVWVYFHVIKEGI